MGIGTVGGAVGIGPAISTYVTPLLAGCPKPVFLFLCIIFGIVMNVLMTAAAEYKQTITQLRVVSNKTV